MKKFDPFFEFYSPDSSWYGIMDVLTQYGVINVIVP